MDVASFLIGIIVGAIVTGLILSALYLYLIKKQLDVMQKITTDTCMQMVGQLFSDTARSAEESAEEEEKEEKEGGKPNE